MPEFPPRQVPFRITTAAGQHPLRIDRFLQQILPAISRHKVHELIESGLVLISTGSGEAPRPVKKSQKIGAGVNIEIYFRDQRPSDIEAEDIPLDIAYEDEYLLVINKPSGMVTHPAHGHFSGTMVNALMHYLGKDEVGVMKEELDNIRPGIVHRLDKGTSGLLVVAKNEHIHRKLTDQFAKREVKREYRAIVWGKFRESQGIIDAPLGRHPGDRKRFAVVRRGGKNAVTTFRVEETFKELSFLSLRLETGRTHQIRVHLTHLGHPLFGDPDYGGRNKRLGDLSGARRKFYEDLLNEYDHPALHARTLGFIHPVTQQPLELAADLPKDFANLLTILRKELK